MRKFFTHSLSLSYSLSYSLSLSLTHFLTLSLSLLFSIAGSRGSKVSSWTPMKYPDHSPGEHRSQNHSDLLNSFSATDLGTSVEKKDSSRGFGLTLAAVFGFTGLATIAIAFPFIKPGFRRICLPYVPASDVQVSNVLKALQGSEGKVIDLGSGDGRLVSSSLLDAVHHDCNLSFFYLSIFLSLHLSLTGFRSCSTRLSFNRR